MTSARQAFARIDVRAADAQEAERVAAEAYAAGAVGLEEREDMDGVTLLLYAPARCAEAVHGCARAALGPGGVVAAPRPVADVDWAEQWKFGLEAISISARLCVRPACVAPPPRVPGQLEVVIELGRAFGLGSHPSTRLALEWIDVLAPALAPGARLLDVGTGTGVLALATARLAEIEALALDVDPVAAAAARANARANGLADRVRVVAGTLAALRAEPFDLVVANLLRLEFVPLIPALAERTRAGGRAVFSGFLEREGLAVAAKLAGAGFRRAGARSLEDASGERWCALLMTR